MIIKCILSIDVTALRDKFNGVPGHLGPKPTPWPRNLGPFFFKHCYVSWFKVEMANNHFTVAINKQ